MYATTDLIVDAHDTIAVAKRPVVAGLVARFRGPLGTGEHFNLVMSYPVALDLARQLAEALQEHGNVVALARDVAPRQSGSSFDGGGDAA